jgi:hypothetical protein
MQALVKKLALTLTHTVHVIVKERSESAAPFQVTTFQWDGSRYYQTDTASGKRPLAIGIWHEVLTIRTNAKPDSLYASRLFLRREGQLVLSRVRHATAATGGQTRALTNAVRVKL